MYVARNFNPAPPGCCGCQQHAPTFTFGRRDDSHRKGVEPAIAYKSATGLGVSTDSRFSFKGKTDALAMDGLSLRSRAVLGMVGVDGNKAIQLFQQIGPPQPPAATCPSGFAPDVSIYYDALERILGIWKARKPRTDAEAQAPFLQLQEVTSATVSPVRLAPLAKVLDEVNPPTAALSSLLNTLAGAIGNFPVDDDSFYDGGEYTSVKARNQLAQLARAKQISVWRIPEPPYRRNYACLPGSRTAWQGFLVLVRSWYTGHRPLHID